MKKKTGPCNCRIKATCPLDNKCLTENVIYETTVKSKNEEKKNIGSTGGFFLNIWYNHMSYIKNIDNTGTELSICIWKLKEDKIGYDINWNILHKIDNNKNV